MSSQVALPNAPLVPTETPARGKQLRDLTMDAIALFKRKKFNPLEELISTFKEIKELDDSLNDAEPETRIQAKRLKFDVIKEIVQYGTPKLRSVEHTGQVDSGITIVLGVGQQPKQVIEMAPETVKLKRE